MLEEVIDMFAGVPEGVVLDATVGGGGHAAACSSLSPVERRRSRPGRRGGGRSHVGAGAVWRRAAVVRARFDGLGTSSTTSVSGASPVPFSTSA